jgi:formyltetrahydrofolate-dependent phosphoribosylglycinamide formyltransferase
MKRIAVLISGGGTNLQALIDAVSEGRLQADIALVVSNRKTAYGLTRAEAGGIPTLYFPLKPYSDQGLPREAYDTDLAREIDACWPDLIVLAGWMHIFTPAFLEAIRAPVINLHPALPGQFPGANGIADAFAAFQRGAIDHSGCMVHYVIPELDAGPVIAQAVVPFEPGDTLETFSARMHIAEHKLIVEAVKIALGAL